MQANESVKKAVPGYFQYCPVPGQEAVAQTGAQEAPSDHQKHFYAMRVAQTAQRSCAVSLETFRSHLGVVLGTLL